MNSIKLAIPLHSLYMSIHTKDERKCICLYLWCELTLVLWCTASFGVFSHEMKCNGMTIFMEFITVEPHN